MRRYILTALDIGLILIATLIALALRENFDIVESRFETFLPYLGTTATASILLVPGAGLNKPIWRFSGVPDYLRVTVGVIGVSVGAAALSFVYNRLDGVARSLPFLQAIVGIVVLVGARELHRWRHAVRRQRGASAVLLQIPENVRELTVLVVGVTRLTEAYIQALVELDAGRVSIAGVVGCTDRYVGRLVAAHPVLGVAEDIEDILDGLDVHGNTVGRIVVAATFAKLSSEAQDALRRVERSRGIPLQFLSEILGLGAEPREDDFGGAPDRASASPPQLSFEIASTELQALSRRRFWKIKRGMDALAALAILVILSPLLLLVALLVAASAGFPVLFWQRRPGLGGRSFWLCKFRTMTAAHAPGGRRLPDAERTPRIGNFLRQTRLDELPQLFSVLIGDMSFIGPRPLLPRDQPKACGARLLVRPGLTGWAQVVGGRDISPEDKAALDVWYVRNASVSLDLKIAARTVPIVLFGERISEPLIESAWRDLTTSGIVKGELTYGIKNRLRLAASSI